MNSRWALSSAWTSDSPSQWLPARPRWLSGCLAPWWSIVSAPPILMTEHKQTRGGAAEAAWSGPLSQEISWDSRGAKGRVLTIIPLISFHYYQYSSEAKLWARLEASHKIKQLRFSSITKHCSGSRNIISKIISQNCVDRSKFDAILIFTETTSEKLILSNKRIINLVTKSQTFLFVVLHCIEGYLSAEQSSTLLFNNLCISLQLLVAALDKNLQTFLHFIPNVRMVMMVTLTVPLSPLVARSVSGR